MYKVLLLWLGWSPSSDVQSATPVAGVQSFQFCTKCYSCGWGGVLPVMYKVLLLWLGYSPSSFVQSATPVAGVEFFQ